MCRLSIVWTGLFVLAVLAATGAVCRANAIMQVDVGCDAVQDGWIAIAQCGVTSDVGGTGIDVTLATGNASACACRNMGGSEPLANVETDFLFANDEIGSPGGDFIITFGGLAAGMNYRLLSFHNRTDESLSHIEGVEVTGATNVIKPDRIAQDHPIMAEPAEIFFVAGDAEVSIRYIAPTEEEAGKGAQAFLNGFILETAGPVVGFASASSGGAESLSPALLTVNLTEAQTEIVTVDYAVTGGTATGGGVDYSLRVACNCDFDESGQIDWPDIAVLGVNWLSDVGDITGDNRVNAKDFAVCALEWLDWCGGERLRFDPGQTSKTITIDIIDDGLDEEDETIVVELLNLTGADVQLASPPQHTYTIIDPRPSVGFESSASSDMEGAGSAVIVVTLSAEWSETVTAEYAATGGTATRGQDYVLEDGIVQFEPGETSKEIDISLPDDEISEGAETVELTLSNVTNAKLGDKSQHVFTINDNEQLIMLEEFVGDSFSRFNHASTIAETPNGTLVVAWYGGSSEGDDSVSIWVSRNDGSGWSNRAEIDNGSGTATWNPVLFQPSTGPLLLYYKYSGRPSSWIGAVQRSSDDGRTWSGRIELPKCDCGYLSRYDGRYIGPVKNKPLELPDGTLLCGTSTEHDGWQVHMELARGDYTNDFELIGPLGGGEGIQPTFLVHTDDYQTIQTICRQHGGSHPKTAWSYDMGRTWTDLTDLDINTNVGLDAVTVNNLNDQRNRWHVLVHNPSGRSPLSVAISQDGVNWNVEIPVLDEGGAMDYPSIIQTADKMLHVVYSYGGHDKVKHVVINPYVLLSESP